MLGEFRLEGKMTSQNPTAPETTRLMTVNELADVLRIHHVSVRRFVADGTLPAIRIGGAIRFSLPDVMAALENRGGPK